MARFGVWKPLSANWAAQPRMAPVDIISIHTMVYDLVSCDAMFRGNGYGGVFSHFGIGGAGECWQWQDTAYRAAANLNGNHHIISIECADRGAPFPNWNVNDGSAVPAFTDAQCETLAQLIASLCKAHDIPCVLIQDSKPGRRGIGYHRQGVPLKKGDTVSQTGGELWSASAGKVCPGNRRIAQIPGIVARAQQILNPTPLEDDMTPEQSKQLAEVHQALTLVLPLAGRPGADADNLYGHVLDADAAARQALAEVRALSAKVDALLAK